MKYRNALVVSLAVCLLFVGQMARAADWGTIRCKFVVDGEVPAPAKLNVTKDVQVCTKHHPLNEEVVVGPDGGLANVVVYLYQKGAPPDIHEDYQQSAADNVELDNRNCNFSPHVSLLRTSQTLVLKNSDTVGHNSNITCIYNNSQNMLVPAGGAVDLRFPMKEKLPMSVACNIHPWMKAYLLIQEHPYMALSGEDGVIEIKNVPAGQHEFIFWHEKLRYLRKMKIGDGTTSKKGRLKITVEPGDANDLGVVKIPASKLLSKN